jgi:segregation and condensation protein B
VISYEQPVTRARVDELRQVNSESTVRSLLDKRLITVKGRAETPGRPFLYGTTRRFLEVFGLHSLDDLPPRPPSLESAKGIDLGMRDDDTPGLDDLPGFDEDMLEQDELED